MLSRLVEVAKVFKDKTVLDLRVRIKELEAALGGHGKEAERMGFFKWNLRDFTMRCLDWAYCHHLDPDTPTPRGVFIKHTWADASNWVSIQMAQSGDSEPRALTYTCHCHTLDQTGQEIEIPLESAVGSCYGAFMVLFHLQLDCFDYECDEEGTLRVTLKPRCANAVMMLPTHA